MEDMITIMSESQPLRLKHFRRSQDNSSARLGMLGTLCIAMRSTSSRYASPIATTQIRCMSRLVRSDSTRIVFLRYSLGYCRAVPVCTSACTIEFITPEFLHSPDDVDVYLTPTQ